MSAMDKVEAVKFEADEEPCCKGKFKLLLYLSDVELH